MCIKNITNIADWLLKPMKLDDFVNNYWESNTLVINRNEPDYFKSLISLETLDNYICSISPKHPEIRIVNSNDNINPNLYTSEDDFINVAKLFQLYDEGNTIVLNQLHRKIENMAQLCRKMEDVFSMPFQTNIYLTPENSQGFKAHYDAHCVFILQIRGSKNWKIFNRAIINPTKDYILNESNFDNEIVTEEFTLNQGDIAYIPRGYVHNASTGNSDSLHVTLGAHAYTWVDLINEAVKYVSLNNPDIRGSLPIGFASVKFNQNNTKVFYKKLIREILNDKVLINALDNLSEKFISTRKPILHGQLMQIKNTFNIDYGSLVFKKRTILLNITESSDLIIIKCYGNALPFPSIVRNTIMYILDNYSFEMEDIPGEFELKRTIIDKLINFGVIYYETKITQ